MSSTIRVETITLGDELLLGIRENSHLTYLGAQFAHHGIEPAVNLVIRDNPDDIKTFFADSSKRPTWSSPPEDLDPPQTI